MNKEIRGSLCESVLLAVIALIVSLLFTGIDIGRQVHYNSETGNYEVKVERGLSDQLDTEYGITLYKQNDGWWNSVYYAPNFDDAFDLYRQDNLWKNLIIV